MVSMKDVARISGYSVIAVSQTFNLNGTVGEECRKKIRTIAAEIGFVHRPPMPECCATETEKAWVAGIVDGEGCLSIAYDKIRATHKTPLYRPCLKVTMGHKASIDRIYAILGFGQPTLQHLSQNPRWNDSYTWAVSNRMAIAAVKIIRPYLFTKAEEADVLLEFGLLCNDRTGRGGVSAGILAERERLFLKCRSLKPKNQTAFAKSLRADDHY